MKKKIIPFFYIICITFALAGCAQSVWLYRVNVQQGNVITPELVHQVHIGMPKDAVCDLLGPPVLIDAFNDNRWTYIYTYKPGRGKCIKRTLIVYFKNNHVCSINTKI